MYGACPHLTNKNVYICFLLAIAMLAASPLTAAEPAAPPAQASRKTFVVRVDPRTGKLVRRELVVVTAKPTPAKSAHAAPAAISNLVEQSARAHGVDPLLVHSVIQVESDYDPNAVSPKGAEGLMQLMPPTARMLNVSNTFDPGENIEAGVKYLKHLQELYKDDRLALAAYNAGPGAVDKFKAVPPYPETRSYVEKVGRRYGDAKAASAQPNAATPAPSQPSVSAGEQGPEEKVPRLEQFVDENGRLHLTTAP